MKKYYKPFIIGIFFLLLAIVASRIWTINPLTEIVGDGGDKYEYFGYMHLANQNISKMAHPFSYTNTLRYPQGFDFGYGRDGIIIVLFGALLGFIIPLPLAYNFTVIAVLWLNLAVPFFILRQILKLTHARTDSINYISFIGAIIEGWSPYLFSRLNGQLNLSLGIGMPILFYTFFRLYLALKNNVRLHASHFIHIALAYLLISFSSAQYLLITVQVSFFVGVGFLVWRIIRKKSLSIFTTLVVFIASYSRNIFYAIVVFLTPFLFFQGSYLKAIFTNQINLDSVKVLNPQIRPTLFDIFIPNAYLGDWWSTLNPTYITIEKLVGFGIIGWLIIVGYLFYEKQKQYLYRIIALFILLFISLLFLKPLFVPEPARIWIVFSFPIIVAISQRIHIQNKMVLLCLIILLLIERSFYAIMTTSPFPINAAKVVKKQPGNAVMHVPLVTSQGYHSALSYYWQKPVVDGYFLHIADTPHSNAFLAEGDFAVFNCETSNADLLLQFDPNQFIQKLKKNNIFTIVLIKKGQNGDHWHNPECKYVRRAWDILLPDRIMTDEDRVVEHKFLIEPSDTIQKRIYADTDGILRLERLTVWPRSIDDITVATPGGLISPNWNNAIINNNDLIIDYFPRVFFPLRQGEYIELLSNKSSKKTEIYPMIYYYFEMDQNRSLSNIYNRKQPYPYYLNLLWKDDDIEVYRLN